MRGKQRGRVRKVKGRTGKRARIRAKKPPSGKPRRRRVRKAAGKRIESVQPPAIQEPLQPPATTAPTEAVPAPPTEIVPAPTEVTPAPSAPQVSEKTEAKPPAPPQKAPPPGETEILIPKKVWMELIPSQEQLPPRVLQQVFQTMYGSGQEFEIILTQMQSRRWPERRTVRYFVGGPPQAMKLVELAANASGFWMFESSPPKLEGREVELEFSDFYVFPLFLQEPTIPGRGPAPASREEFVPEMLFSALSEGGTLRVRVKASREAPSRIRRWAVSGGGGEKDLVRGMTGIVPKVNGSEELKRREREKREAEMAEKRRFATQRASEPLMYV
ncbi:MAG: hypothetical protein QW356_04435, partial [Candidatus Hadarchaeales archaeon]